ncbi:MAG TPA: SRPBCC family protein [Solirubrobacteraceae bacterium]
MTLLSGSSTAEIDAPIGECWAIVADIAAAPGWQRGLERVDVVESDPQGRAVVCDTVTDGKITKVRCRIRIEYSPPHRMAFRRIESDDVDEMEGSWELEEIRDGGATRATYRLAVDPGHVGFMARPLERALRPLVVGGRADELAKAVAAQR